MISNFLEIFVLAAIQGIFEFLPVSSAAHLFLISEIYEFKSQSLLIDISLHLGSLLAILIYFRNEFKNIINNKNLFFLLIFGSLPLLIFGAIIYKSELINYFRNVEVIAWATLIFGILLYFSDKVEVKKKFDNNLSIKNILIIGMLQVFALIPGASRSGLVITAGRFLNFDRYDSSKISFYLSIPALAGASTLGIKDAFDQSIEFNILIIFSVIFSFLLSYLTIKYFLFYVKKFNLNIFVYYRILLAAVLLVLVYS